MRTLKEECLYLHDFESLEEARQEIDAFIERYNRGWLLERHGYRTPAQVPSGAHPEGGMIRPPTCPGNRNRYNPSLKLDQIGPSTSYPYP